MKHSIPRRFLALLLSIAMVASMTCTAFATETVTTDTDPFDFSAEIAAQEAEEAAAEEAVEADAETGDASDEAPEEDAGADSEGDESAGDADSEADESTGDADSEDSESAETESLAESAAVKITSGDVGEDGCLYVDGVLYTGYYMDEAGLMFKVSNGVYSAYSGNLSAKTTYYQAGSGTVTLSVGMVYLCGEAYTGYYMTSSGTLYYTDATSGYAVYSGLLSGSSTYLSSDD